MREVRYLFVCDWCGRVANGTVALESPEDVVVEDGHLSLPAGWFEIYAEMEDKVYTCCSWECVEMLANRGGGVVAAANE